VKSACRCHQASPARQHGIAGSIGDFAHLRSVRVDLAHVTAQHSTLLEADEGSAQARRIAEATRELGGARECWNEPVVLQSIRGDGSSSETSKDPQL
jgi:hypothetical protein